jgi:hypothetical protein
MTKHGYSKVLDKKKVQHGHKLCMDSFFSSPDLFNNLTKQKINCCRTVWPKRKGMLSDLLPPNKQLKCGDILSTTRDDLTAVVTQSNGGHRSRQKNFFFIC